MGERLRISRRTFFLGGLSSLVLSQLEGSNSKINPFQSLSSAVSSEIPKREIEEIWPELADLNTEIQPTPILKNSVLQVQRNSGISYLSEEEEEKKMRKDFYAANKEKSLSQENALIKPLIVEAEKRRAKRIGEAQWSKDKDYLRRIDWELNSHYVNVVVFSCGETYEPPTAEAPGIIIATPTIFSISRKTGKIASVTISHDLRVPEMEKIKGVMGKRNSAQKLDSVVLDPKFGSFEMSRLVLENATGLSVDFQVVVKDVAVQKFIDSVFGEVNLDVPFNATLGEYYLYGKLYGARKFRKEKIRLNGTEAVGFIKGIPKIEPGGKYYGWDLENSQRQFLIIEALRDALFQKLSSPDRNVYRAKLIAYMLDETMVNKDIKYDFDLMTLGLGLLDEMIKGAEVAMPAISRSAYIVDPSCAKEPTPIHWVDPNHLTRTGEAEVANDYKNGVFPHLGFEVPFSGNPYGDLIDNYYRSIRVWVRNLLLNQL